MVFTGQGIFTGALTTACVCLDMNLHQFPGHSRNGHHLRGRFVPVFYSAPRDLLTLRNVARASVVAMMAGADFIKTSTGKEPTNATLPVGLVMTRAIREYAQETGMAVGFKPAGGIRTAKQSLDWLAMIKEELGDSWLRAEMFRFGASGLLGDIERQLEHFATGRYSAEHRHPLA